MAYNSKLIDLSFPTELLLEVIGHLEYEAGLWEKLALVHPRFAAVIACNQTSIVKHVLRTELRHTLVDFAPYPMTDKLTVTWLSNSIRHYDVVDGIFEKLRACDLSTRITPYNEALAYVGLLLMYQLNCRQPHKDKVAYLKSLQRDPLIAIYVVMYNSGLAARQHGKGLISQKTFGGTQQDGNEYRLQIEVEQSFNESMLNLGPQFIYDALFQEMSYETTLLMFLHDSETTWEQLPERDPIMNTSGPLRNPEREKQTLWDTMMDRLATTIGCPRNEVRGRIADDIEFEDHLLAWIGGGRDRLLRGLNLIGDGGDDGETME
ncbi:hypothetical protein GQ43DRAFT_485662 [Delitschia confertaspora ATCC 74209]|uniref:Uncharacterized protein n=1 Tax=Delitschia confertaspora ATCC 74209 TaxID=1513339 RepID=A0A9P4JN61_9PLEO|nr:hypothetical protein GQ43DRAFT_485662 [Delitschia confertaspora ATCC 74209]